ncbi:hypothetical protein K2X92_01290, partial [Candidatus Gracilibacteria bacterium]|nr:hypothetical protein [Candidatus Gracilibacteria bacterium]
PLLELVLLLPLNNITQKSLLKIGEIFLFIFMILQPTSHFIGLSLQQSFFQDLYVSLDDYIIRHHLSRFIQFQRPETIHITLYYLGKHISDNEKDVFQEFQKNTPLDSDISLDTVGYFYRDDLPYICYILPRDIGYFARLNNILAGLFHRDDIGDNQFSYVPHITLIRILDFTGFAMHQKNIEIIISDFITKYHNIGLSHTIDLYAVDSSIKPELQERIG